MDFCSACGVFARTGAQTMNSGWWFAEAWATAPVLAVSWVVWVIGSITLHELAHGWAALRQGDSTPRDSGHMSLNPLVHMGQTSLIVFAIVGIAWGAMPVNPSRFRSRYGDAIVSLAGPAMNIGLAVLSMLLLVVWIGVGGGYWTGRPIGEPIFGNLQTFFFVGVWLNLVLAGFNLLPIPPLDGYRILSDLSPRYRALFAGPNGPMIGLGLFIAVFFFAGPRLFDSAKDLALVLETSLLRLLVPAAA